MTVCCLCLPGALAPRLPGARLWKVRVSATTNPERESKKAMAFIPVPDCVQCQVEGSLDGQQTINNLYFRSTIGPRSSADVIALAQSIADWYATFMLVLLNVAWLGRQVKARGLTNEFGFVAAVSMLTSDGVLSGECLPNNVSMAVSFRTNLAGRSNHGRNYVPALSDTIVDGNNIDSTWAQSVVDAYSELVFPSASLPSGWIWVVVSRYLNNEPRAEGIFQEIMSVQVTDLVVDSMRSRLPGRGR